VTAIPDIGPVARVQRFIARWQAVHPGRRTVWSDSGDHGVGLRLEDLQLLLALAVPHDDTEAPS
jgi:hypothetical protein